MAQQPLSEASDTDTEVMYCGSDQESDSGDHDDSAGGDRRGVKWERSKKHAKSSKGYFHI